MTVEQDAEAEKEATVEDTLRLIDEFRNASSGKDTLRLSAEIKEQMEKLAEED
jgi:hypothetical protein